MDRSKKILKKNLKNRKRKITCNLAPLFILLFLFSFITSCLLIQNANAETSSLGGANLQVTFSDLTSYGINTEVGNRQLDHYEVLSSKTEGDYTLLHAKAFYTFQSNFYSYVTPETTFVSAKKIQGTAVKYCSVITCTSPTNTNTYNTPEDFFVYYDNYELGALSSKATGFSGYIDVDINVDSLLPGSVNFSCASFSLASNEIQAIPTRMTIIESEGKEIGQYDDYYQSAEFMGITVNNIFDKDSATTFGQANIESTTKPLGVYADTEYDATLQQGVYQKPTAGQDDILSRGFFMQIKPDIKLHKQKLVLYERDKLLVDIYKNFWDARIGVIEEKSSILKTQDIIITKGWHDKNYNVKLNCSVEVEVFSLVDLVNYDRYNRQLDDPQLNLEDYYWENMFYGTGADIQVTDKGVGDLWWEQNQVTVIIVAIIATAIIAVVIKMKMGGLGLGGSTQINIFSGNK
jgi:hypothetical protein